MAKTKKITDLQQTDGKIRKEEDDNQEYQITSLDQLFGDTGFSKYKTMDLEEYKSQLAEYNVAELRTHAVEVAHVLPATSRERTEKRLILEFQKHVNSFRTPKTSQPKEKQPSKEVLRIMAEVK